MAEEFRRRVYYAEAFWRAHHEAWKRSELNQREYCAAEGISLKAFGNWRAKFKAEPQPLERKLLNRRGGLSHTLSHGPTHPLGHVPYLSSWSEKAGCTAATRGASAAVQRSREAPNPPRGSAKRKRRGRSMRRSSTSAKLRAWRIRRRSRSSRRRRTSLMSLTGKWWGGRRLQGKTPLPISWYDRMLL
jgi:hypothetical protein